MILDSELDELERVRRQTLEMVAGIRNRLFPARAAEELQPRYGRPGGELRADLASSVAEMRALRKARPSTMLMNSELRPWRSRKLKTPPVVCAVVTVYPFWKLP